MNKTINKPSITKKQVWSLILEIKSIFNNFKRNQKTLSVSKKINNDNLRLTYSFDKQKIINKNFKVNLIDKNSHFLGKIKQGIPPFLEKGAKKVLTKCLKERRLFTNF